MCKLQHNRVVRFLGCLVLVLSLLVNLSPLKAEATAVVAGALTFEGLMAALYSMGIGIVATHFTVELWNKIGNSLGQAITETGDDTITEAWIDLEAMYDAYIPGGGQDPDDELKWAEKLKHALSRGLLAAIAGWLCTLVNMGGYEVEGDAAATGWSFYGDTLLPTLTEYSNCPYVVLYNDGSTYCFLSTDHPVVLDSSKGYFYITQKTNFYYDYAPKSSITSWNINSKYLHDNLKTHTSTISFIRSGCSKILWSNYDVLSYKDGSVLHSADSDPSSTQTEIIEPSIYVGDIPEQIQNGDKDEDNLILPIIDPFRVIQSPDTALDDVNQLQQQLANGTTTLDQYLEQVQLQEPTIDPDPPSTDPTYPSIDPSDPSDPSVPDGPVSDIKHYGLDLKDYFPFCIPFDLYEFFNVLIAEPKAPVFHWELHDLSGNTYNIDVDLSAWDSFAAVFRRMQLLLFIVGLAAASRKFIKW